MNIQEFINLCPNKLYKYSKVKELSYKKVILDNPKNLLMFECSSFNRKELENLKTNIISYGYHPYLIPSWEVSPEDKVLEFGNGFCIPEAELVELVRLFDELPNEGYFQVGYKEVYLYDCCSRFKQYNALLLFDKITDVSEEFINTGRAWIDYKNADEGKVTTLFQFASIGVKEDAGEIEPFYYGDFYRKSKELVDKGFAVEVDKHPEFPEVKLFKLPYMNEEQVEEFSLAYYSLESGNNMSIFCSYAVADFIDHELKEGDYYEE